MNQELLDRIDLIERMISEGRRSTHYWGWSFALWGTGQLIALFWSMHSSRPTLVWGCLMGACGIITALMISRQQAADRSQSVLTRPISAVWFSFGISLTLLAFLGNPTGLFTTRSFCAVFFAFMGLANNASGMILRWPLQIGLGVAWWLAAVLMMFAPEAIIG